mgnify:CR=1 FL=1
MVQPAIPSESELPQNFAKVESVAMTPTKEGMMAVIGIICSEKIVLRDLNNMFVETAATFKLSNPDITLIGPGRLPDTLLFNVTGISEP